MTSQFPEMQIELSVQNAVLDGELVVLQDARPDFESVMTRFQAVTDQKIQALKKMLPAHFVAFDVLYVNGHDVTSKPLIERLALLSEIVSPSDVISVCPTTEDGHALFQATKDLGLEGIVSKAKDSRWVADTRSQNWLKVKHWKTSVVEIVGIRKDEFGWLIKENGIYKGVCELVPTNERKAFYRVAKQIIRSEDQKWQYIDPIFKCKVKYHAKTKRGTFRTPSFIEFVFPAEVG